MSVSILSLIYGIVRGDTLFEPVHLLILLALEYTVCEFLFKVIVDSDEAANEQTDSDDLLKGYTLDEKSRKTMRYNIIYTVAVPSLIFILNLLPSPTYYFSPAQLQLRLDTLPAINSFTFLFVLLSRIFSTLSLASSSSLPLKHSYYLLLFIPPVLVVPHIAVANHLLQLHPLSLGQLLLCFVLAGGILGVKVVSRGLRVIQDSRGFRREQHKDMREMARLDFTMDFD